MRTTALLAALFLALPAGAATISGSDLGGGDLSPLNGDVLSGTFTDVGQFTIPAGATVYIAAGVPLRVYAATVTIAGTLDGSGRGQFGGAGGGAGGAGQAGFDGGDLGTGGGGAGAAAKGGGGGAYGAVGGAGAGSGGGTGGALYGSTGSYTTPLSADDIFAGSGGGGGGGGTSATGGPGASGGAAIYIEAASATVSGAVLLQGATAAAVTNASGTDPGGGGGGSGGGLLLRVTGDLTMNGATLNAAGGAGGNVSDNLFNTEEPGGGGAGGRIKLFARTSSLTSVSISTAGGAPGGNGGIGGGVDATNPAVAGAAGTISYGVIASSPAAFAAQTVYVTSIAWNWSAVSSFGDALPASDNAYHLYAATTTSPRGTPELSVAASSAAATTTALTPNTTYDLVVTAYTDWGDGLPSNAVSTHTLASPPALSSFTAASASGLTLSWDSGAPANPSYTRYEIQLALDGGFSTGLLDGYATGTSSAPAGLSANTTYYLRVRAVNIDGVATAYTAAAATATLADVPASPSVGAVYVTSAAFSWTGGGNPAGTEFEAQVSSDNFFSLAGTSTTLQTSATFFSLTPGQRYYLRARALNREGTPTAWTTAVSTTAGTLSDTTPPSTPGVPVSDRQFSYDGTVRFAWSAASSSVGILSYRLVVGTFPGGNDFLDQSGVTTTSYTVTGLSSGRTYYASVSAYSNAGVYGAFSAASDGVPVFVAASTPAIPKPYAWPNPFDPSHGPVQIGFYLEAPAGVTLKVYSLQGSLLRSEDFSYSSAGNQIASWDGNGSAGRVAPGGYIVVVERHYGGRTDSSRVKVAVLY
ncbi:MAG: hypothetical protein KGM24_06955 [Elusimicrobia bacterium]|nr:hypothetical protein [Elusimicrobiota bacterium]